MRRKWCMEWMGIEKLHECVNLLVVSLVMGILEKEYTHMVFGMVGGQTCCCHERIVSWKGSFCMLKKKHSFINCVLYLSNGSTPATPKGTCFGKTVNFGLVEGINTYIHTYMR
mmetsp:Transcript_14940/g.20354  ORF Transcript_14940/g.20354 Transcript_14940/m.20354 type:complete len:113 (+) Transcript_14940:551-889(+)